MTILIDIRTLMDERYSGVAEYTFELLSALFEIDHENHYILYYNSAADVSRRIPVFNQPNIRIVRSRYPNKLFNYALLKLFRRPRFDCLVGEPVDIFLMPHFNFAAWSPVVKSIITVHDLSFLRYPEVFSWRKNAWHRLLSVRKLMGRFNAVVAVSEHTRRDIVDCGKVPDARVRTIMSGLSPDFQKLSPEDPRLESIRHKYRLPEKFIFFLSTVEPRKNIEGLIQAFVHLKAETGFEEIKLVIAGRDGWKSGPIYELARKAHCNTDIVFLDYIDREDKVFIYNLAAVFAFPSFYEGFGHPPLEAMASGTPTIVADTSSLPEVVGNAVVSVDPYNPPALSAALKAVLTDRELASSLSVAGLEQSKRFSWRKTAYEYLRLFDDISH